MAGTVDLEMRTRGFEEAQAAWDRLTTAEQRALLANTQFAGRAKKTSEEAGDAYGKMARQAVVFAGGLLGVTSAQAAVSAVIGKAKEEFRQLIEMQTRAAAAQQTMADATGDFIAASPGMAAPEVQKVTQFAQATGAKLGEAGPQRVMQAMTAARQASPAAGVDTLMDAVNRATMQAQVAPGTDVGATAAGILNIMESAGVNSQRAQNMLVTMSRVGGGMPAKDRIGRMSALATKTGKPIEDMMAQYAVLSGKMGEKRAMGGVEGMLLSPTSTEAKIARSVLASESESLSATRASMGGDVDLVGQMMATKQAALPTLAGQEARRAAGGALAGAQLSDVSGASWDDARAQVAAMRESMGMTSAWQMPGIRSFIAQRRGLTSEEFVQQEQLQAMKSGAFGRLGAMESRGPVMDARTPEAVAQAAIAGGAIDTGTNLDRFEQALLRAAGVSEDAIKSLQVMFEKGLRDQFAAALQDVLVPILRGPQTVKPQALGGAE